MSVCAVSGLNSPYHLDVFEDYIYVSMFDGSQPVQKIIKVHGSITLHRAALCIAHITCVIIHLLHAMTKTCINDIQ